MNTAAKQKLSTRDLTRSAVFAALMAVCSWITIPATVPFTLQTLGVFLAVGLLGGRRGTLAIVVYVLLGAIGMPVFAGFSSGLGGTSSGYIVGFVFSALLMWAMEKALGRSVPVLAVSMVLGLIVCYAFGTAWFYFAFTSTKGAVTLMTVLGWCVIPFIIPDLLKIACALLLTVRLRKYVG